MSVKFTMVLDDEVAKKMDYIATYYGRSRIKEITWACKEYIKIFETTVGEIEKEDT